MIKVTFNKPTPIISDEETLKVLFVFCNKIFFYDDEDFYHRIDSDNLHIVNDLIHEIKSIEHFKPTDL